MHEHCFSVIFLSSLNTVIRFENSSKVKLLDEFAAPDWDKNKSDKDCPGPCLPNFGEDGIVDNQSHMERLIQDVLPILTPYGKEVLTYDINKLKIFMYGLPTKFNYDLIQCATQNRINSMCFNFANSGFGPEMNMKISLPKFLRFYKTHQFALESDLP